MVTLVDYIAKLLLIKRRLVLTDMQVLKLAKEHVKIKTNLPAFSRPDEEKLKRLAEISVEMNLLIQLLVINLDNLREIREKFLNNISNTDVQKILSALKPCTDILDSNELEIRKLRNNIHAHGVIMGDEFSGLNDYSTNLRETQHQLFLSTKCAVMFINGLTENLISETTQAKELVKEKMTSDEHFPVSDYFKSISKAKDIQKTTVQNLIDSHLNREIGFVGSEE